VGLFGSRPAGASYRAPTGSLYSQPALTAATTKATPKATQEWRQLIQPWQLTALTYYASVGECWYAAQFYARTLKKVRTYAAVRDENGEIKEIEDKAHPAVQAWDRVQDPGGGGRGQLQASYGQLMFLIGDGYLCVTADDLDPEEEQWEYLSPSELRAYPGTPPTFSRLSAPGLSAEQMQGVSDDDFTPLTGAGGKQAAVYRLYRRHPQFSKWADGPMRGVLKLFEELVLLELAVGARAKSRAAGPGILYVPNELSFGGADHKAGDDPSVDPFAQAFQAALIAPIKDPGSAGSVTPFIVRGPAKLGDVNAKDALFHLQIHDPNETYPEENLRTELITRIAQGLDIPAEVLTGMSDANHWTAWQIDEASWTAHVQPMCEQMCGDFGSAYLRPICKQEGVEEWKDIVVWYDAAEVINHPDRVNDAREVFDRGGLSLDAMREVAGFDDADKPSEDEHNEWLAVKMNDKTFIFGQPDPASLGPDGKPLPIDPETGEPVQPDVVDENGDPADVKKGVPGTKVAAQNGKAADVALAASASLAALITGAAELAVERTRELAGSRIRSKAKNCLPCRERIDPVVNSLVASALGPAAVQDVAGGLALTAGGTDTFKYVLGRWGVPVETTDRLAQLVERHASQHLYEGRDPGLPDTFAGYVERVL
jgi:hypothetical protein